MPSSRKPLTPAPMPSTARCPEISSSVAMAIGGERGVARVRVGDARPELDALGAERAERERRVHLAEEALVGQPQ
jgi:hypothetical protein